MSWMGDLVAGKAGNYPVTTEVPVVNQTTFIPNINHEIFANMEDVKAVVENESDHTILIDSREEKRYLGIEEPIDKKAGRIPGAINKPWFEVINEGFYKPVEVQKERFKEISQENQIIVYCGSGVTAAPNFLALKTAGFEKVKLYLGSFSDWISYQENKIQ